MEYYGGGYTKENNYPQEYINDNNAMYEYLSTREGEFNAAERDSAVKKLFDAFQPVLAADGGRYNKLCSAVESMNMISSILNQTNGGLGGAWSTASANCQKMEQKIADIIIDVVKVVNSYIEATYAEEINATRATEQFNTNMNSINTALDEIDNI